MDVNNTLSNDGPSVHPTQAAFISHNNSIHGLVVLSYGLKSSNGNSIIDINTEPWICIPHEVSKPKAALFCAKVNCCYQVLSLPGPKPHPVNWSIGQCQDFLTEHPITNPIEISYLKECIKEQEQVVTDAIAARVAKREALEKNWTGKYPFLQLIHCLVDHDELKRMYLNRKNLDNSHLTLENRNSIARQPDVYDLLADKWNIV